MSRYKHKDIPAGSTMTVAELRKANYIMDDSQWLMVSLHLSEYFTCMGWGPRASKLTVTLCVSARSQRILFLESIAGVPGMVAACLRHLRSLRLMQRDNAWINTLLQGPFSSIRRAVLPVLMGSPDELQRRRTSACI